MELLIYHIIWIAVVIVIVGAYFEEKEVAREYDRKLNNRK